MVDNAGTLLKPLCPRCESAARSSLGELPTAAQLAEYTAGVFVEASLRVAAAQYEARLEVCAACDALREGVLCAHCGCFAQFRARPKSAWCPHPAGDRWEEQV
jgi:hypothetical protein